MKKSILLAIAIVALSGRILVAQGADSLVGRYQEEKNKITLEVYRDGAGYAAKQIDTPDLKKKQDNGKIIAKDMIVAGNSITGIVVNASNGKEYHATWEISNDGTLALKIKLGFLSYSDTWKKRT